SLQRMASDTAVKAMMERVTIAHDPAQEAPPGQPRTESARVIVLESGGKRHEIFVPYVVGFPSHPMSSEEVEAQSLELKLLSLWRGGGAARQVIESVRALERLERAASLIRSIAT